jgi:hypothetical protein
MKLQKIDSLMKFPSNLNLQFSHHTETPTSPKFAQTTKMEQNLRNLTLLKMANDQNRSIKSPMDLNNLIKQNNDMLNMKFRNSRLVQGNFGGDTVQTPSVYLQNNLRRSTDFIKPIESNSYISKTPKHLI